MNSLLIQTQDDFAACLVLREEVFVCEQGVPYELEMDSLDDKAVHFLLRSEETGEALATARLVESQGIAKIGRVAVRHSVRGQGLGRRVMLAVLDYAESSGYAEVILDAQTTVKGFYIRLGFQTEGEEFWDAGIRHVRMRKRLQRSHEE